jgi:hypothetical protein
MRSVAHARMAKSWCVGCTNGAAARMSLLARFSTGREALTRWRPACYDVVILLSGTAKSRTASKELLYQSHTSVTHHGGETTDGRNG